jgi:hypothetical protein
MIISRDRYLDDTALHHISLALQTRTHAMHSLLSDAPEEIRERIGEALARTLADIQSLLRPLVEPARSQPQGSSFRCGT